MLLLNECLPRRRLLKTAAGLAAVASLGGCAGLGASQPGAGQGVLERATAYWGYIKVNDRVSAWPYEELSLDPRWTLQSYLKRGGVVFERVDVRGVISEQGDDALLDVQQEYSVPLLRIKAQKGVLQDKWKRIKGVWYHVDDRGVMFSK